MGLTRLPAPEDVYLHVSLALDVHYTPVLEKVLVAKTDVRLFRHLNTVLNTLGLHTGRGIHRVAPNIVQKLLGPVRCLFQSAC